ncbi:MAG TPA: hypothetical protein VMS74_11020 [Acidimicrobiia bacterium]|nr:hypothetical protein [Acidimicrobiia bacterium]
MATKRTGEEGATIVMVAAAVLLLFGIVAIVVDLAALRYDVRADRLASDAAATAGVMAMDPFAGTGADTACEDAWDYLLLNLADSGGAQTPPNCAAVFVGGCDSAVARTATASAGPYSFTITQPVPNGHPLMGDQDPNATIDGVPCQRLGVTVERVRDHTFARVLGFESAATEVASVARIDPDAGGGEVVPLLVLEPIDCAALFASGQGNITVSYDIDTQTPGFIVVDSDASTCGSPNPFSIDAMGTQQGWIRAIPVPTTNIPSAILSYALAGVPPADATRSFDPSDLTDPVNPADITDMTEPVESWFRLYPEPIAISRRITRAPIDWRYNCQATYPDYPLDLGNLGLGGIPVPGCPDGEATYINYHVDAYGSGVPSGFQVWTDEGYSCSIGSDPPVLTGNWYVNCPGDLVVNGAAVRFVASNVVFQGGIDLRSSAVLEINSAATSDHFVFVRDGTILKRAQALLTLGRTFVYLADGAIDLRAGAGPVNWTAPEGGTFEDLALWSEGVMPHEISGQAGNILTGTFFTPFAEPFGLTGQGGQSQFEAQFITRRLEVKGQGVVKMIPDPDKTTLIPIRAVRLIR